MKGETRHDIRDQIVKPTLLKHEMHVTRSPTMSPQLLQQFPHWPIIRNRIRHGHDPFEPKHALVIALNHCPAICFIAASLVLHVIFAMRISFPDIDFHAGYGLSRRRFDGAEDEEGLAIGIGGYVGSRGGGGCVVGVKGAKDCAFSTRGGFGVID